MTIKFTAKTVESLKGEPGKRVEYFDASLPGLALRITEAGSKSWTVLYRHRNRLRRLTLGSATVLTLAQARDRAREALAEAQDGGDPAQAKQDGRKAHTIEDLAAQFIEKYAKKRKRSWKNDRRILKAEVLPVWRGRAIVDIKRRDVRNLVNAIAERGVPTMANRTVSLLSKLFKYALDDELIEVSPAFRIPRPSPERQRDRVLTEDEVRSVWQSFDALDEPAMSAFYKLRCVTAQRACEVSSMRWADLDLDGGWWTIPAGITKNKLAHRVPLSPTAIEIIKALQVKATFDPLSEVTPMRNPPPDKDGKSKRADYVLAGARGKRQQAEAAETFTTEDFRGHDLRRTAASLMAGGGIPRLTISKILNHVERNITAVYDRHSYDAEKQAALAWWDCKLRAILDEHSATVLPFRRGA